MRVVVFALFVSLVLLAAPVLALATPSASLPANGAYVQSNSQVFSWTDNFSEGALDHWYLEISTSPAVDYYPYGFFSGNLAYSSGDLKTSSVNLNAIGRQLAPGTYYWHVGGYYGAWGSLGTAWTPVRSFTVQGSGAVAPAIAVSPAAFSFSATQGAIGWLPNYQTLSISNQGGGTLLFTAIAPPSAPWFTFGVGSNDGVIFTLPVDVKADGLAPGTYTGNITILDNGSSPAATNSPRIIPVTFTVLASEASPPTGSSISIQSGAAATNSNSVTLNLAASDSGSGMGEMRFDNNDGVWSAWTPYAATRTWYLPGGAGPKTVRAQFRDKLGNTAAAVSDSIVLDLTAPGQTAVTTPDYSTRSSKDYSFTVNWSAADEPGGSGVAGYDVYYRISPATTWTQWGGVKTGGSAVFAGAAGKTYQFQARAIDAGGNYGAYSDVKQTVVPLNETSGSYSGTWKSVSQTGALAGKVKSTTKPKASVTFSASGTSFSLLVTKGGGRSKAKVYVDGKYAKTIDTRASRTAYRQLIALKAFASSGAHKVKIVNSATSGRRTLQVDGLAVVR
jgi:hypothetical protein